jgi:hypothetical protein
MLILVDPPEQPLGDAGPEKRWRADYLALAAVLFAVAVSLLGVALVVLEASADPPPPDRPVTIS